MCIIYSYNNSSISVRNNQAFLEESLNIVKWLLGERIESGDLQLNYRRFTPARKSLLKLIFTGIINHKYMFYSHETMQEHTGLSRSAVIRALKLFEEMKLIVIDHRNLMHKSNIYSLGEVLKNATVVRYLSDKFKELVPAFCRTMERLGNIFFAKKPKERYTVHFKSNATLTTNVVVFVDNTNTNTTTLYYKKRKSRLINNGKEREMDMRYKKVVKEEPVRVIQTCISHKEQEDIVERVTKNPDLAERIRILETNITRIHTGSKPYFKYLINKFKSRLNGCWTTSYNANKCQVNCTIDHTNNREKDGIFNTW